MIVEDDVSVRVLWVVTVVDDVRVSVDVDVSIVGVVTV